jgi:hypothetical protein
MTTISYLYQARDRVEFLKEAVLSFEAMVALMEPDDLEGHESTERMSVTNLRYARQIEEAQNAISQRSMERNIPYYAVPDALVIWNIRRMRFGRGTSVIFYNNCNFFIVTSLLTFLVSDPIRIHGWRTKQERRLQMSTFNHQGN